MRFFGPKENSDIKEIREAANVVGGSSTSYFSQNFKILMSKLFNGDKSVASNLFEGALNANSNSWVESIKSFVSILEPKSKFGEALITNRDIRIDLQFLNMGDDYETFLLTKVPSQMIGIKKEISTNTVSSLEAFFLKFVYQLVNLKQFERKKRTFKQSFEGDDFYYFLVRNPIIHLLRLWLVYSRTKPNLFNRILNSIEFILLEEPIYKYRSQDTRLILRSHHFYGLYLLIEWKIGSKILAFLSFVVEYLDEKLKNFNILFCYWLRIHTILLKRGSQYELNLRKQFEQILEKGENRVLQKQRIFSMDTQTNEFQGKYDQGILENLSFQIDTLITNDACIPTGQILATIWIIIGIFKSENFGRTSLCSSVGKTLSKYSKSSKKSTNDEEKIINNVKNYFKKCGGIIEQAYYDYNGDVTGKYERNTDADNPASINSRFGSKRSFPTYQKEINVWQHPLRSNQVHLMYVISFQLAKLLDLVFPPKQENRDRSPSKNLRWMATYNSLGCFLALLFMIRILF